MAPRMMSPTVWKLHLVVCQGFVRLNLQSTLPHRGCRTPGSTSRPHISSVSQVSHLKVASLNEAVARYSHLFSPIVRHVAS